METKLWNDGWRFSRLGEEDSAAGVTLPHDAMLAERRGAGCKSGVNGAWFAGADYRYTKRFDAPPEWLDKTVYWEFEGVYHNAEVYLNDVQIAAWPYGYTRFFAPAGRALREGENTLTVIARNADQPNSRWYSGAGIYRPVRLHVAPAEHLLADRVRVRTVSASPAQVEVSAQANTAGQIEITLLDASGKTAARARLATDACGKAAVLLTVPEAKLWSCEHPYLYTCRAVYTGPAGQADETEFSFGIRTVEWNAENGLLLNGERVILRGACIHHDNGILGAACWPDAVERKVRLLKRNGYNALRSAHNPCSRALLDACDRQGVLIMDEFVDCWYIHKTVHDYVTYFNDWWQKDLAAMVAKDYNHPSVILYSTGNEVSETAQKRGIALAGEMTEYLHSLDATRPVTCGVNIFFNLLSSMGFGVYSDEKAAKEEAGGQKKAVGSEFYNNLAGLLGAGFMKAGASTYPCDVKTRGAFANMDIAGYNYGILRYEHDLKKYPQRLILGSETFCSDAYRFWEIAKKQPRIIGDFVWAGIDYLGEVGVGSWEYPDYAPDASHGPGWMTAGSGRLDLTGAPLAEADYTRVAFELEKGPILAVRPLGHKGKHSPSAWKMTNARRSWSWNGCEGEKATVEVYARAAKVVLTLNGKVLQAKTLSGGCKTQFTVPYAPGTLMAVAYDENNAEIGRDILHTAGAETKLCAEAEETAARQGHLLHIRLRYADAAGTTKPRERHKIKVAVKGGKLLALGSACPYNPEGYLNDTTDTYYGEALAIVLADGSPFELMADDGERRAVCRLKNEKGED